MCVNSRDCMDILKYPLVHESRSQSKIAYMNHIPTECGTAKYTDMETVLRTVIYTMTILLSFKIVLFFGDQQTINRVLWLIRMNPGQYSCIVPLPGDFHADGNFLMAVHALYYEVFVEGVFRSAGFCVNSIQATWGGMELYNRYRHAYETLIVACMAYLISIVPVDLLQQPALLMTAAEGWNPGFALLLHFLFDVGLPWLHFKRSIRCGDYEGRDSFYAMSLDVFRATGKIHYAILVIDYFLVLCGLVPAILAIWRANCTYSDLGIPNHDGAFDWANEGLNNRVKTSKPSSPDNINKKIKICNALRAMDKPSRPLLGTDRYESDDYTRVKQEHVDKIVDVFRMKLGTTFGDVQRTRSNPFGGTKLPWKSVEAAGRTRASYIDTQLQTAPFTS